MGNQQSTNRACEKCNILLPNTDSQRNQYIEENEYVVYNFLSAGKYFRSVNSTNSYVCSPCFFNALRDLYERRNETRFDLRFEDELTSAQVEKIQEHVIHDVFVDEFRTQEAFDPTVDDEDICDGRSNSIDRLRLIELTKQAWKEETPVSEDSLIKLRSNDETTSTKVTDKLVSSLLYSYLYSRYTFKFFLTLESHNFMRASEEYLRSLQKPSCSVEKIKNELLEKSNNDLAWLRFFLVDLYVHMSKVSPSDRAMISHYLACLLNQCFNDVTANSNDRVMFTICIIQTVIYINLNDKNVCEDEVIFCFLKTMLKEATSHCILWSAECKHLFIREKLRFLNLHNFSRHLYLIYSSTFWNIDKIEELLNIILQKTQLKETIDIFNLIKAHGFTPSDKTLSKLKSCQDINHVLKHMTNTESETTLTTIFDGLREKGYSTELLSTVRFICLEVRNVFDKVCEGSFSTKLLEEEVKKHTMFLSRHTRLRSLVNIMASVTYGVNHFLRYRPRDVQLISCIIMILTGETQGRLLEIGTGEGKSCVIAMLAISLTLFRPGKSIDIVTSSSVLAERDFRQWQKLYQFFDVSFGTNTSFRSSDNSSCYQNTVVLGTVGSFSSDFLRHELQQTDSKGKSKFQIVIVDEVDSMLLDRGIHFTYLSQDITGMRHLEPLMSMIWSRVSELTRTETIEGNIFWQMGQLAFYQFCLNLLKRTSNIVKTKNEISALFNRAEERGILPKEFQSETLLQLETVPGQIPKCITDLSDEKVIQFFELCERQSNVRFVFYKTPKIGICERISCKKEKPKSGNTEVKIMLLGKGMVCELNVYTETELIDVIRGTVLSQIDFEDSSKDIDKLPIPTYYKDLVNSQITVWIFNAFEAKKMQLERDYLIQQELIYPIDYKFTGMIESNKKWGDGLQQFLEMKHALALSPMAVITNFMSYITFFQKYEKIYGVTATLGSEVERKFLRKNYKVSLYSIPPWMRSKLFENLGKVTYSKVDWFTEICSALNRELQSRAVLVMCEDIKTADELRKEIEENCKPRKIIMYTRNSTDEEMVVNEKLCQGHVVLATNLAGRGTDIKVSDEVNANSGLHLILTFLPMNQRVERQARGRTARGGNPGSTELIILSQDLHKGLSNVHAIHAVKLNREKLEKKGMNIFETNTKNVLKKDSLFEQYCIFLQELRRKYKQANRNILKEIFHVLHEKWGIWLKIYSTSDAFDKLREQLRKEVTMIFKDEQEKGNAYSMVKIGNVFMLDNKYRKAIQYYDNVINFVNRWSVVAYYNKAFCVLKYESKEPLKNAIECLEKASNKLQTYFDEVTVTIACCRNSAVEKNKGAISNPFVDQAQNRIQILTFFQESIEKLVLELKEIDGSKTFTSSTVKCQHIWSLHGDFQQGTSVTCKCIEKELNCLRDMGILQLYALDNRPWYRSDRFLLCVVGVSQIAIGCLLLQLSCGTLVAIAPGLIGEGIKDILNAGFCDPEREYSWEKWGMEKGMSLALICLTPMATHYGGKVKALIFPGFENVSGLKTATESVGESVVRNKDRLLTAGKVIAEKFITQVACKVGKPYIDSNVSKALTIVINQLKLQICSQIKEFLETETVFRSTVQRFKSNTQIPLNDDNIRIEIETLYTQSMKTAMDKCVKNVEWQRLVMGKVVMIVNWVPNVEGTSSASLILELLAQYKQILCSAASTIVEAGYLYHELNKVFEEFERNISLPTAKTSIQERNWINRCERNARNILDRCAPKLTEIICEGVVSIIKAPLSERIFNFTNSAVNSVLEEKMGDDSDTSDTISV